MTPLVFISILGFPAAGTLVAAFVNKRTVLEAITLATSVGTFLSGVWLTALVLAQSTLSSPQGWFYADALSAYFILIVSGSTLVVTLYSIGYVRRQVLNGRIDGKQTRLYYILLQVFLLTMMFVLLSNNLGFLWIGTEATTLATAFLVAFYNREHSLEAAWKYVIICSVGIAIALFGIILTYFSALRVVPTTTNALNWSTLMAVARDLDPSILKLAFLFILVGFGTKAGLAPMHTWKPDAYSEAPAPVSALLAAGLVNVALYALIRFHALVSKAVEGNYASNLFLVFGLLSMGIAVPFILVQRDVKRLLAYSSVEHVGIIAFALGIGTPLAYTGALLHVLNNALAKLLLFLTTGNLRIAYHTKIMRRISGALRVLPASSALFLVGVFAVTGWPPFGLFVSEVTIISAGFNAGKIFGSILFILFVSAIFIGFIYYAGGMIFGPAPERKPADDAHPSTLLLLAALAIALLGLGIWIPDGLRDFIQRAIIVIQG